MSDLSSPPPGPGNLPELSVSDVSRAIKRTLEERFERVRVRGEISGFKRAASGHLYLALKDAEAVLDAVCWRGVASRLDIRPEDGLEVVVTGRITTYPGRSKYQLVIDSMELAGEGALLKLLEERRRKLAAEGLFDEARKRPLPFLPEVIGVVTSPTGAVIRDILHRLAERFPRRVLVWPVLVQGEGAAAQVAAAIEGFNRLAPGGPVPRPDVLIVARGGGSLEDLWSFNEEIVVRAAAASEIPLISAVGHETDTTLIDFASDRRAPTPTAAAEIAVPVRADLLATVLDLGRRQVAAGSRLLGERRNLVEGLGRGLPEPERLLLELSQRLDDRTERLDLAARGLIASRRALVAEYAARVPHPRQQLRHAAQTVTAQFERLSVAARGWLRSHARDLAGLRLRKPERELRQARLDLAASGDRLRPALKRREEEAARALDGLARLLESYSYTKVLQRGFAVVRGPAGLVTAAAQVAPGQALEIQFHDDKLAAIAGKAGSPAPTPPPTRRRRPESDDDQGPQGQLL